MEIAPVADVAPQTNFVSRPAYPALKSKPKVSKPSASPAKRPMPASVANAGSKKPNGRPIDPMVLARLSKLMTPMIANGGR